MERCDIELPRRHHRMHRPLESGRIPGDTCWQFAGRCNPLTSLAVGPKTPWAATRKSLLLVDPFIRRLRHDTRYHEMLAKIGFRRTINECTARGGLRHISPKSSFFDRRQFGGGEDGPLSTSLNESISCGLAVFARFARADVNALAIVHLDLDRLVAAVAADIEAHVVAASCAVRARFRRECRSRGST